MVRQCYFGKILITNQIKIHRFIIKYFKTYFIDDGVNVETIRISEPEKKTNKRNFKHTIKKLENNETYSVAIFAVNTYAKERTSKLVMVKPTQNDKILNQIKILNFSLFLLILKFVFYQILLLVSLIFHYLLYGNIFLVVEVLDNKVILIYPLEEE